MEWKPIESAPKDGTRVLLGSTGVVIGYWSSSEGWMQDDGDYNCYPTHWMPLPEPPK